MHTLLNRLRSETTSGDSKLKFATGDQNAGIERIYALMQCTPDLDSNECDSCLANAVLEIGTCCEGRLGAQVFKPSCDIRFDNHLFYRPSPEPTPPAAPTEGRLQLS